MKNSLLNRFVPKESKFFPLLNQLSQTVLNASELLIEKINNPDTEIKQVQLPTELIIRESTSQE